MMMLISQCKDNDFSTTPFSPNTMQSYLGPGGYLNSFVCLCVVLYFCSVA